MLGPRRKLQRNHHVDSAACDLLGGQLALNLFEERFQPIVDGNNLHRERPDKLGPPPGHPGVGAAGPRVADAHVAKVDHVAAGNQIFQLRHKVKPRLVAGEDVVDDGPRVGVRTHAAVVANAVGASAHCRVVAVAVVLVGRIQLGDSALVGKTFKVLGKDCLGGRCEGGDRTMVKEVRHVVDKAAVSFSPLQLYQKDVARCHRKWIIRRTVTVQRCPVPVDRYLVLLKFLLHVQVPAKPPDNLQWKIGGWLS
mmetsp:Transcript_2042/g.6471  ORF Transcript_2042/g.6471 Transcript_2042/m.6471 type:complete len:252 (+) Transcript_2042:1265-2020(+)